jgi:hypothetical protein
MTFEFRTATREGSSLIIAIAGASGSGKTFSALTLARGLVGPEGRIAVLDTEAGRARHYADFFTFQHHDMTPPFEPERFREGILAAEAAGFDCLIVDSMSDEYEGEGGLQDMHDAEMLRLGKAKRFEDLQDWQLNKLNAPSWNMPKTQHKRRLMSRLRQLRIHVIFCLRAEEKIKFVKVDGKTTIESQGWVPICEKRFMYDMTVSFTLTPDQPGTPLRDEHGRVIFGKIQEQHLPAFPPGRQVSEASGRFLAEWAAGATPAPKDSATPPPRVAEGAERAADAASPDDDRGSLSPDQIEELLIDARAAADKGSARFGTFWDVLTAPQKAALKGYGGELRSRLNEADAKQGAPA